VLADSVSAVEGETTKIKKRGDVDTKAPAPDSGIESAQAEEPEKQPAVKDSSCCAIL